MMKSLLEVAAANSRASELTLQEAEQEQLLDLREVTQCSLCPLALDTQGYTILDSTVLAFSFWIT